MNTVSNGPLTIILSQPVSYIAPSPKLDDPTVLLSAIAVLISLGTLLLVIRQFFLDKQKFKNDMFEKRYKIYENTMVLIGLTRFDQESLQDASIKFNRDVIDAHLLLPKLVSYLEEIRNRAMDCAEFQIIRESYKGKEADDDFNQKLERYKENKKWFSEQTGPMSEYQGTGAIPIVEKFKEYLEIRS